MDGTPCCWTVYPKLAKMLNFTLSSFYCNLKIEHRRWESGRIVKMRRIKLIYPKKTSFEWSKANQRIRDALHWNTLPCRAGKRGQWSLPPGDEARSQHWKTEMLVHYPLLTWNSKNQRAQGNWDPTVFCFQQESLLELVLSLRHHSIKASYSTKNISDIIVLTRQKNTQCLQGDLTTKLD